MTAPYRDVMWWLAQLAIAVGVVAATVATFVLWVLLGVVTAT